MSMSRGATTCPRASITRRAGRAERGSTAATRPSSTATSASRPGAPLPSMTWPARISRSSTGPPRTTIFNTSVALAMRLPWLGLRLTYFLELLQDLPPREVAESEILALLVPSRVTKIQNHHVDPFAGPRRHRASGELEHD